MPKPLASLSLDLDNKWSYMKTHGDVGWEAFPSYLDIVVPRVLELLAERDFKITFFIVGQDAALEENRAALRSIAEAGHEIGNHSFHHEPWLHLYSDDKIREEFDRSEMAIREATGAQTLGFRGPGFSFSKAVHAELDRRGYEYDASTFPTFIGPLARAYYFFTAKLSKAEREDRKKLFGSWKEGFRSLRPYVIPGSDGLIEIPVTTMPIFRAPFHLSYLLYLAGFSELLAKAYFNVSLGLCRLLRVRPSFLLHPLDFMGAQDAPELAFFPAMQQSAEKKLAFAAWAIDRLAKSHRVVTMREHAAAIDNRHASRATPSPAELAKMESA